MKKKFNADEVIAAAANLHFIGIKGVAMAGLAVITRQLGKHVTGSDVAKRFGTDGALTAAGIRVASRFSADNLASGPDAVVVGASWPATHGEVRAARARGIPVVPESELRGWLSRQRKTVAVSGVHGKSTTTALLAWVLTQAGRDPSYLVGAPVVAGLPGNGHWGRGEHFIVEGDEYAKSQEEKTAKFLDLDPWASVITSLEWEHVDVYHDVAAMEQAFGQLVRQTRGPVVACTDWPSVVRAVAGWPRLMSYGSAGDAEYTVHDFRLTSNGSAFTVKRGGATLAEFASPLIGRHNALNATAALIICLELGLDVPTFARALLSFRGLARRQQVSVLNGVTWIDDYAHHPTEIGRTLEAIRERYPTAKMWVVFQPHLASRTRALLQQFATSFAPANRVLIAELFASAREAGDPTAARDLAQAVAKYHEAVRFSGSLAETSVHLKQYLQPGDVVVTMGAGDVYKVRNLILRL